HRIVKRLRALEERATHAIPFWCGLQKEAVKRLMHPHREAARTNQLLAVVRQFPDRRLEGPDRDELFDLLQSIADGEDELILNPERALARVMPVIMEQCELEHLNNNPIVDVQLLGIKQE
ncbi:MAG TPA: hypothetical protein VLB68_28860, partial [Pyrinomonadaceae bacterium]|nr:hypothetical protein [Pyrinomonadaceae bacterium]